MHCSGLLAGHVYYIKELTAPAGYPDISEEVITLKILADGTPQVSSTKDTSSWQMATVTSSEDDPLTKGKFMFRMEVKNSKQTSITAKKIWSMLDGTTEVKQDHHSAVTVKLQRYSLQTAQDATNAIKYNVRVVSRYFSKDGKPTNRDNGDLVRITVTDPVQVPRDGSITFTASATGDKAGIHSISGPNMSAADVTWSEGKIFYINSGWTTAMKSGTFTAAHILQDTTIYVNFIGEGADVAALGASVNVTGASTTDGVAIYSKAEDNKFNNETEEINGQALQVTLQKSNKWTTTWNNLPVSEGDKSFYYYVKEIPNSSATQLADDGVLDLDNTVPAYVTTYSSDGLSGGGTITVRNNLKANKIRLRKRDDDGKALNGAEFQIYLASEYLKDDGKPLTVSDNSQWMDQDTYDETKEAFVSSKTDGDGKVKGFIYSGYLPRGTYYVVETKAPEGYKKIDGPILVEVDAEGMLYKLPGATAMKRASLGSDQYYSLYIEDPKVLSVDITIAKVTKGEKKPLFGATFTLTKVDANNKVITGTDAREWVQTVGTTGDDTGKTTFTGLTYGRYRLEETTVPEDYVKLEGPYYIDIDVKGRHALDTSDTTVPHELISADGNTYTIENTPGVSLPSTGGRGPALYYALGTMLVLAAAVLLIARRRAGSGD